MEVSLMSNPNNTQLKRDIDNISKTIKKCVKIKELYYEKINLRNKITSLEGDKLALQEENRNLKINVSRGIEKI